MSEKHSGQADASVLSAEQRKALPLPLILFLTATCILSSSIFPLMLSGKEKLTFIFSVVVCLLCSVILFFGTKKTSNAVCLVVLIIFIAFFVGSPILPAIIFGSLLSVGAGSSMICSSKRPWLFIPFAIPFLSYAVSFIITRDPVVSLASLTLFFPILALGMTSRLKASRATSVSFCAIVMTIIAAVACAIAVFSAYGNLSYESISAATESFKSYYVDATEHALTEYSQLEVNAFFKKQIRMVIDTYVNFSIGIIGAMSLISAYIAHSFQLNVFKNFGMDCYLTERYTKLSVSTYAAVIFVVSHVLSYATDSFGNTSLLAVVCGNLSIILLPSLLVISFKTVKYLPQRFDFLGIIILIAVIFMIFTMFSHSTMFLQIPTLLALVGAFSIIIQSIDAWAKEHYGKGENK